MTREEAQRLFRTAGSPERLAVVLRSKTRRVERQAARKAGRSLKRHREEKFGEAVDASFERLQSGVVGPKVLHCDE